MWQKMISVSYFFDRFRGANDPSCFRYMLSLNTGEPFIRNGLEFLTITIVGQSFVLHQIRKMIGKIFSFLKRKLFVNLNLCGENNTRMDMRGNGQRPAPSILMDSCFQLLGSYQEQAIDRSKPVVRHIQGMFGDST